MTGYLTPEDLEHLRDYDARMASRPPIADVMTGIVDSVRASAAAPAIEPPSEVYMLTDADLDDGILPEYRGAQVAPRLVEAIESLPVSIALLGPPGTGKTRQVWACFRLARARRLACLLGRPQTLRGRDVMPRHLWLASALGRDSWRILSESSDILRHRYDRSWLDEQAHWPGWLAVDDVGFSAPCDWAREAIYDLANQRRALGHRTLWTSNLGPDEIRAQYSPAIASRICGGIVIEVGGQDRRLTKIDSQEVRR